MNAQIISIHFDDTAYKNYVFIDTVNYHHNIWQVGRPNKPVFSSAHSLPNAMVTDTIHAYPAHDTSVFVVKALTHIDPGHFMPIIYDISFWYQLDIDTNVAASVEISGDSGLTWRNMITDTTGIFDWTMWGGTKPTFDTSTHGWKQCNVTFLPFLTSISYDTTFFRFKFISKRNDSNKDGWIIDDIQISYYIEGRVKQTRGSDNPVSIYPNPSSGDIYIQANKSTTAGTVSVYDMMGREVYRAEQVAPDSYLRLPLPDGVYTLRYTAPNIYSVTKIIVSR